MARGGWLAVGGLGVAGVVGLGAWSWFLAGRTLDVMDQWSSVLSGFGTLASLVVAVIALVVALRGSGADPGVTRTTAGSRSVRTGDAAGANITVGDHSPIHDRGR